MGREELGGWSAGRMAAERGVALFFIQDELGSGGEREVGESVGRFGFYEGSVLRMTEDAVVLGQTARIRVRVGDSRDEDERRREEGETGEEASSRHSDLVLSAQKNRSE
jgi:hypothetical protein